MRSPDRVPGVQLVTDHPAFPPVSPGEVVPDMAGFEVAAHRTDIMALCGRMYAGLGVQLLWSPITGETFCTVTLAGETETFPVPRDRALDAFEHPYAYGASLKL